MSAPTNAHADSLFAPLALGGMSLPNRLAVAPMTRISASPEGLATPEMARYYRRFAAGGFGLVISEGIYTDQAWSQAYAGQPGLSDGPQAAAWRPVVQAVQAAGGRMVAQLMHAGALAQGNRFRADTVAPSALRPVGTQMGAYRGSGPYPEPRAIGEAEIRAAIDGFADAARRAIESTGFDGLEIHGANGYLLDQFLTGHSNRRGDGWGGASLEQRARLSLEVVDAVRRAVGPGVPLGLRLSQAKVNDFHHRWPEAEAGAARLFARLAEAGQLDYLHITEPEAWRPAFAEGGASLVQLARRHAPGLPVIANGGLHEPARARQLRADGAALIALGRGALANPDWPRRVAAGAEPRPFDPALLAPLGNLKETELA
ncbi:NADH:flavin oxidoreductase [Roseateles sp. DAIF2]|uniref:oxidoreductase n=1 Tax=Roseateles sp. DAIF2 TaxID=2714952 RepID=UPI0018A2655A|nr:NADH:flavin oxidoreductase [Roseateles sp. DAIF2]QPF75146.1 NADH:flavin oxidoreductase [Roseateles sp. DAIF2]